MNTGFDSANEDFFNAFDKKKEDQQKFGANDGFDHDAFGSGWGDTTAQNTENLQKLTISNFNGDTKNDGAAHRSRPSRRKSDGFQPFEGDAPRPRRKSSYESTSSLESFGSDDGAGHSKPRRKSNTFEGGERESRSRQRRKSLGGGAGADTDKKERRRKPRRGSTSKPGE